MNMRYRNIKIILDVTISTLSLVLIFPLLIVISAIIYISMGRPIFFTQQRAGKDEKCFKIYKFRTMRNPSGIDGPSNNDEYRITTLGQFLRSTSLDEIPSLVNIIKGDMSIVGPRPLLPQYSSRYESRHRKRFLVKPGLTGWAQINGRNSLSWHEKFEFDIWYVENVSASLDFKIIVRTLPLVFSRKGISAEGHATMPRLDHE
jgi:lipopolysaccharide/colanic/teichoic acid biosynthesis glycosyltransferase